MIIITGRGAACAARRVGPRRRPASAPPHGVIIQVRVFAGLGLVGLGLWMLGFASSITIGGIIHICYS